ncbi:MAG TPA: hypothetical protein VE075_09755 [Thermoanaerobaculia bacterium]|nr:hypothetical protein [Thermoanaerobaculia bacterium]
MLADALLLFVLLVAWGAQAVVPWRLAGEPAATPAAGGDVGLGGIGGGPGVGRHRRLWRLAGLPLALAGLVAAYALANRNPDAAVAVPLVPLRATYPGAALLVLVPALLAVALLGGLAGDRLGPAGERLSAAVALAACAATAWAGELLRAGEGPAGSGVALALLIGCRLVLMLAAGELLAPGRPRWAAAGGFALLVYLPLLPAALRGALWGQGLQLTCLAAALLLLLARWLPGALRPPALAAGLLLAAVVLTQAGHVSQALAPGVDYQELPVIR